MKILFRVEYLFFISLAFFIRILPRSIAYFVGRQMGLVWAIISRKRFQTAYDNISFAFPDYTKPQKIKMVYECFKNMALSGVDLFRLDLYTKSDFEALIDSEGKENIDKALLKSKSVIFMTAHLGFWESGAFVFPFLGIDANFIAKKVKNPLIDAYILKQRTCKGGDSIDKKNGIRKMLKTIQEDKSIAILIDQHIHKEEAVYVPFFGRNAYTSPIIVTLAAKKKLPIIPIFCYRQPQNRFKIVVHEPIIFEDDIDNGVTNTTYINKVIEDAIRKSPEQWMWIHRRWRD